MVHMLSIDVGKDSTDYVLLWFSMSMIILCSLVANLKMAFYFSSCLSSVTRGAVYVLFVSPLLDLIMSQVDK